MTPTFRVVVVGGGIAGLTAAYTLRKIAAQARANLRLTVLESSDRWGGKIQTERRDGFVIEGGPDTFVSTKPWGVALCRELGLEDRLQGANMQQRRVFVVSNGKLVELPEGLAMMVPSRIGPMVRTRLLSPLAKLRMALDLVLPPRGEDADESLGRFISRRLGRQVYERLIEPLMSGIYAGDGDRLSLASTFPYLRDWERRYGSLTRGALRTARSLAEPRRSVFLTPIGGLAEIVEGLLSRLRDSDLRLRSSVRCVERSNTGYLLQLASGEAVEADAAVIAAPAHAAAQMLARLDPKLAGHLSAIEYVSTATVSLAFRSERLPRPLDGHGYVVPRIEGRQALACTWTSTKFPHRAPAGGALLRVFIGRAGIMDDPGVDEAELIEIARHELAETLGINAEPLFVRVARWPRSMPQYNLGHPERLRQVAERLDRFPGLRLAGAAYTGIGIPDCIRSGEEAARAVHETLNPQAQMAVPLGIEAAP
ncbi:MAG TPA: protoporphyrinogen oxidase [Anaerolineales bacterium]|nr:protoporphyrinogen oxidase [Anaerolineales bacterium]